MTSTDSCVRLHHQITHPTLWDEVIRDSEKEIEAFVSLVLQETRAKIIGQPMASFPLCEVSFLWTDDATIRTYNRDFRGEDHPTNVLSFPSYERAFLPDVLKQPPFLPLPLGDLVFAYETLQKEAALGRIDFCHHLAHLIVHGMLHLLGYDHTTDEEAIIMEQLEIDILKQKGVPNPYPLEDDLRENFGSREQS